MEFVAKSAPDGYTLLINAGSVAINMSLYKNLNYDSLRDFVAISIFSESPNVLIVHPSLPVKSAKELVALAKARPGKMNFSSSVRYGIFAPSATPRDVVNTLASAIAKAARSPDTRQRLLDQGAEPVGNSPEEFAKIMREEVVRWAEVVKVSGAKAD